MNLWREHELLHYIDVTSTSMRLKSPGIWLFVHYFVQDDNTGNIKAPNYWPFVRENHMGPIYSTNIRPAMRKAFPCHGSHHIFLITHLLVAQLVELRMMDLLDWELIKSYIIYQLQKYCSTNFTARPPPAHHIVLHYVKRFRTLELIFTIFIITNKNQTNSMYKNNCSSTRHDIMSLDARYLSLIWVWKLLIPD